MGALTCINDYLRLMEPNWAAELSISFRRSINLQTRSGPLSTN